MFGTDDRAGARSAARRGRQALARRHLARPPSARAYEPGVDFEDGLERTAQEYSPVPSEAMTRRILSVVGTRPNFVKMAPIVAAIERRAGFEHLLVHTGQHYDEAMSEIFLDELGVGAPDRMLQVGSGTHAVQTARVMERLEPLIVDWQPDLVLVPGDVNSTLAAALTASKLGVRDRARRGGPALVRPHDAGGDQPHPHRPAVRPALHPLAGGARASAARGLRRGGDPRGRQHDDRHARRDAPADRSRRERGRPRRAARASTSS